MKKLFYSLSRIIICSIVLLSISSCTTQENINVKVWIDAPQDGAEFEVNTPIQIMSHAYAKESVSEILLYINGEAYRRDVAPETGQDLISFTQEWRPSQPGRYIIQVKAIDKSGEESLPAIIGLVIGEKEIRTPTPIDAPTEVDDISPTPVISETPVITPTFTPTTYISITPTLTYTIHPTITAQPVDNQAPPVPLPMVPANGLEVSCRSTQNLVWQPVNDQSGIDGYYVKLERLSGTSQWESIGGYGPISDKQYEVSVDCGIKYRWMVRAQDGAGNFSAWSSMSEFIVTLN